MKNHCSFNVFEFSLRLPTDFLLVKSVLKHPWEGEHMIPSEKIGWPTNWPFYPKGLSYLNSKRNWGSCWFGSFYEHLWHFLSRFLLQHYFNTVFDKALYGSILVIWSIYQAAAACTGDLGCNFYLAPARVCLLDPARGHKTPSPRSGELFLFMNY